MHRDVLGIVSHDVRARCPDYKWYMHTRSCSVGSGYCACDTAKFVNVDTVRCPVNRQYTRCMNQSCCRRHDLRALEELGADLLNSAVPPFRNGGAAPQFRFSATAIPKRYPFGAAAKERMVEGRTREQTVHFCAFSAHLCACRVSHQRPKAYFSGSEKRRFALARIFVVVSVAYPILVP
jgi:hypothetical protein